MPDLPSHCAAGAPSLDPSLAFSRCAYYWVTLIDDLGVWVPVQRTMRDVTCILLETYQRTPASWRFALGETVRWAGDGELYVITARRWVERQILPPYAEYQIAAGGGQWEMAADLDVVDVREERR